MADQNSGDNIKIENIRDSTIIVKSTVGTEPKEIPIPWMAPEPPDDFVPRPYEFEQLRGYLLGATEQEPVAITTALRGAGGYGKTTLAAALCHDQRVRDAFPQGILWITLGENPTNLPGLVEDVVYALTGERPGFVDVNAAAAALAQAWGERRCLLVVDDVWNEAHLRPFLRGGSGCTRLITTRNRETLPPAVQMVDVDAMRQAEAVALLSANLPTSETAPLTWPLQKLAQRLGEWPTLLKLINRVLQRRSQQQPLAQAVAYVNEALDRRGLTAFDQRNAAERHQAVAQTIGVSLELLTADERQRLAELAIFPEDIEIPLLAVQKLWQATGGLDAFDSQELCQQLYDLSLLLMYRPQPPQFVRLHDVLRGYFLGWLGEKVANIHYQLFRDDIKAGSIQELFVRFSYLRRYMIYHLHGARQMEMLRQMLMSFGWMRGKLQSSDMAELLADYDYLPTDPDVQTVKLALQMAAQILTRDKGQLLGQLHGRLLDQPSAAIQAMLAEGRDFCAPSGYLIPTTATLPSPRNPLLMTLSGHLAKVRAVAITLEGNRVVSASDDKTLKIWDLQTGRVERTLVGHSKWVTSIAITLDGQKAVSSSYDKTLIVWNLNASAPTNQAERILSGHSHVISAVAIAPNGEWAVSASYDQTLKVWNLQSGQAAHILSGHSGWVTAVAITPDGKRVISASSDHTLKIWSLTNGQEEFTLSGHSDWVSAVAIAADGRRAVSASYDKTLKIWNLNADALTGQAECTLSDPSGMVNAVAITPNGKQVVSASDKSLKVWNISEDTPTGQVERTLSGHSGVVRAIAIARNGEQVVSASDDHTLKVWNLGADTPTESAKRNFSKHLRGVLGVAIAPDGNRVVSASYDQTLKVWNLSTGQVEHTFSGHSGVVNTVAITLDGKKVISASNDRTLKVWNLDAYAPNEQAERTLTGHSRGVNAVVVSPDGNRIVSASFDKTLKVWNLNVDVSTGQAECTLSGHSNGISSVAIFPDGRRAISASYDKTLKIWGLSIDAPTGQAEQTLYGHTEAILAVAITPDGMHVVSGSYDKTLRIWSLDESTLSSQAKHTLFGHSEGVSAVAISPDSRYAVSTSYDQTLKIWSINGVFEMELDLGTSLNCVAISSDGQTIVVGDGNGTVHFLRWQRPITLAKTAG
ncbi:MAG: NB-ARC domain-containing protein [Chloroflexota bacterium]